ncbi:MAG: bifunctional demethylmenaquinone methyltransferase/2-methoxy-6-polyprenyl-1,4-benzoquinol methylase UbiE [Saprospiraceae bacterium]|nr:bifunctional demethylmenaquinone methyltransferase/2-methoxy-6-polyprenyl-1,4-benzoquinol methylase UbiE [Saprospiraceae bacterium]MBK8280506.1 bifunctional demethylmenaquinone methyltransferase/2-methoxy-6-polyprenyl-1,4-benzoquinol methylase UbiE [Saprospiraceae bacterium]MBP7803485.1 bifunctional demethylmenaquinone methyltransferase/2-methoxy-6-polyprenyl-1,4-benzoquinol methylase UbiE [Saprospiraceae bacterium]MBP8097371.1 bifunctional demethylmenaquinone methyltransferase/2-methoxy-6-po
MIKPYSNDQSKKQQVREMFDGIAPTYDFLNRFLSLGIDVSWRKKSLKMLEEYPIHHLLDIATGTGDFALMAADILKPDRIVGLDLSAQMLEIAKKKNRANIDFIQGDSEALPFEAGSFDGAIVAFGVRNFENLGAGLKEIHRVLTSGAPFLVLEFSRIERFPMKQLFFLYSRYILPVIGKLFSMDFNAYHYLHESMHAFPSGTEFATKLQEAGFKFVKLKPFTLGICTAYLAEK